VILSAAVLLAAMLAQEPAEEEAHLSRVLAEASTSTVDYLRALEKHLERFPKSNRREEIERTLAKAAIETRDDRRLLIYGPRVVDREGDSPELLERMAIVLLRTDDKAKSDRARDFARRLERAASAIQWKDGPTARVRWKLRQDHDRTLGKALVYQSRAAGNLGEIEAAVELASRSYSVYPGAEAAREQARWLARQEKLGEAIPRLADAFAIPDADASEAERARDRVRLGEWHRKAHGSEIGLGDLILAAYDRTAKAIDSRRAELRRIDPNAEVTDPMQFTLGGLDGKALALTSLRGKVIVLDFWATWCTPCRAQHPLYEAVIKKYAGRPEVVFLNISTDQDRSVVKPFLEENGWKKTVYFEDGLQTLLRVTNIPTTIVINPRGEITSRMIGFLPDRFAAMLAERIDIALAER